MVKVSMSSVKLAGAIPQTQLILQEFTAAALVFSLLLLWHLAQVDLLFLNSPFFWKKKQKVTNVVVEDQMSSE